MEEENLNVDNCIYTSINNDKELLNLPDGSMNIYEFIELTKSSYGENTIKKLLL